MFCTLALTAVFFFYRAMLRKTQYSYGTSFVCPSVTLVDCDHIGWSSSKIISRLVSLGCSLSADPNIMDLLQMEHLELFELEKLRIS